MGKYRTGGGCIGRPHPAAFPLWFFKLTAKESRYKIVREMKFRENRLSTSRKHFGRVVRFCAPNRAVNGWPRNIAAFRFLKLCHCVALSCCSTLAHRSFDRTTRFVLLDASSADHRHPFSAGSIRSEFVVVGCVRDAPYRGVAQEVHQTCQLCRTVVEWLGVLCTDCLNGIMAWVTRGGRRS